MGSSGSTATISAGDMTVLQIITVLSGMNGPLSFTSSSIIPSVPVHVLLPRKLDMKIQFFNVLSFHWDITHCKKFITY